MYKAGGAARQHMLPYCNFGEPVFARIHSGRIWWVDSNGPGAAVARGTFERPFATIDKAINACTANQGDIIYVKRNHAETVDAVTDIVPDVAGIYIIGLGQYDQRPVITFATDTAANIPVSGADVWIENLVFDTSIASCASAFTVTGKGFHMVNCKFEEAGGGTFLICVTGGAANNDHDGMSILGNEFHVPGTANTSAIHLLHNSIDVAIVGNRICGAFASGNAPILSANKTVGNFIIADNLIYNGATAGTKVGIYLANTSNLGFIQRNMVAHQDAAGETPIIGAKAGCHGNYASGVMGTKSGYLYPAADS